MIAIDDQSDDRDAAMRKAIRKMRARVSQKRGAAFEETVANRLRGLGLVLVERVEVMKSFAAGRVRYRRAVSGDFRAVVPTIGESVLVEAKWRDRPLRLSDFADHQIAALNDHHLAGGLSLIAYGCPQGIAVMRVPVPGLIAGQSIDYAAAAALDAELRTHLASLF